MNKPMYVTLTKKSTLVRNNHINSVIRFCLSLKNEQKENGEFFFDYALLLKGRGLLRLRAL
jgi:hypothetical protein